WYNDKKARINQQIYFSVLIYQILGDMLSQLPSQPLSFNHLLDIRKTEYIGQKQDYTKKALDYTIWTNKVSEFVSYLKKFIENTKESEMPYKRKKCKTINTNNQVLNNSKSSGSSSK
ncbi:5401_t:CDS:2, partial [Gigaspora margarita]